MVARFEFTIDDLVDTQLRLFNRSRHYYFAAWQGAGLLGALAGIAIYVFGEGELWARVGMAIFVFVLVAGYCVRESSRGRRIRAVKCYRELLGTDGPFICEVEIRPDCLITRQLECEMKHSWTAVKEIKDSEDCIEFLIHAGWHTVVRNRAFATEEMRRAYLQMAREFWERACHGNS
ncbi:MAG: hypothetical protein K1Y02_21070 [Candidatus Hydrogenedentes bacterium]|nr:hypothetical protein [Candidatus Hydrogenedentota bacterium]